MKKFQVNHGQCDSITFPKTFSFESSNPHGMRRPSDVSFRSHLGWDVADHAETSSKRRNWYVNKTDLFETSLRPLINT